MAASKGVTRHCNLCKTDIGTYGFKKHQKTCFGLGLYTKRTKSFLFERVGNNSKCPICKKLFSPIGVQSHYRIVHEKRMNSSFVNYKPSNGAIKAKEKGQNFIVSKETRKKIAAAQKQRSAEFNKRQGESVRKTVLLKIANGEWHAGQTKKYSHNGAKLDGTWELKYAQYLDDNNIKWERPKTSFEYIFEEEIRNYFPDFYLPELNKFVEIKGRERSKDQAKWMQFPYKLTVLRRKDLINLGIKID